jgi:hypothetical protein
VVPTTLKIYFAITAGLGLVVNGLQGHYKNLKHEADYGDVHLSQDSNKNL